jgi:hypothetical protein
MKIRLSIIIVNFNTKQLLERCLQSIQSSTLPCRQAGINHQSLIIEVIVVDNGSTDKSVEEIKKWWSTTRIRSTTGITSLKIIENKENLGFAKAVNQSLRQVQGEYILLLNSDIIVKPKAIEKMVEFAKKHQEAGVISGRLLNPNGSIQGSCYQLPTLSRIIKEFWFKGPSVLSKYAPSGKKLIEVEAVTGAVFLIPRKVKELVGFFDERYFMYFEDLDYCRRVGQSGFKIYYLPTAEFIHAHGASGRNLSGQTQKWLVKSSQIYHGCLKYYLLSLIIWTGQKCQKIFEK